MYRREKKRSLLRRMRSCSVPKTMLSLQKAVPRTFCATVLLFQQYYRNVYMTMILINLFIYLICKYYCFKVTVYPFFCSLSRHYYTSRNNTLFLIVSSEKSSYYCFCCNYYIKYTHEKNIKVFSTIEKSESKKFCTYIYFRVLFYYFFRCYTLWNRVSKKKKRKNEMVIKWVGNKRKREREGKRERERNINNFWRRRFVCINAILILVYK